MPAGSTSRRSRSVTHGKACETNLLAILTVSDRSKEGMVTTSGIMERLMITSFGLYGVHSETGQTQGTEWLFATGIRWRTLLSPRNGSVGIVNPESTLMGPITTSVWDMSWYRVLRRQMQMADQ